MAIRNHEASSTWAPRGLLQTFDQGTGFDEQSEAAEIRAALLELEEVYGDALYINPELNDRLPELVEQMIKKNANKPPKLPRKRNDGPTR